MTLYGGCAEDPEVKLELRFPKGSKPIRLETNGKAHTLESSLTYLVPVEITVPRVLVFAEWKDSEDRQYRIRTTVSVNETLLCPPGRTIHRKLVPFPVEQFRAF